MIDAQHSINWKCCLKQRRQWKMPNKKSFCNQQTDSEIYIKTQKFPNGSFVIKKRRNPLQENIPKDCVNEGQDDGGIKWDLFQMQA